LVIPAGAVVEVNNEPTPELFEHRLGSLSALLRLALLSGVELTLPTTLHLLLDVTQSVVAADRQLIIFSDQRDTGARFQMGRNFETPPPPEIGTNLLHAWTGHSGKPVLAQRGRSGCMDSLLDQVGAQTAVAVPLFVEHDWMGSLQLFRRGQPEFTPADGRLLWILSLLAENQMARINAMQHLTRLAYTDYLTGLRARGYFEQALEQEVRRTLRKSGSCGLLLVDLDNFKNINDRYGHRAGDEVLRQFARVLTRDMREIDTVARFGGDEFSIILPDIDEAGARFVATRVRDAVRAYPFRITEAELPLSLRASIGLALCPADERMPDQLLRAADLALYQAKQRGKDRAFFWRRLRA